MCVCLQVPSYQGSPHESSLLPGNGRGHPRPTRSRSDHSLRSTYTTTTGGDRQPLAEPVVLKSVYVVNTGWASQVSLINGFQMSVTYVEGKRLIEWTMDLFSCCSQEPDLSVCFLPSSPLFLSIPSALLWRSLGAIQRRCSDKTPTFRECSCDVYQSTGPAIKACSANLYWLTHS